MKTTPEKLPVSRMSIRRRCFTLSNTGLNAAKTEYPELGSVWKAADIKVIVWFLTQKAITLANEQDVSGDQLAEPFSYLNLSLNGS